MKYTLHENLSDTSGVISNLHGFLYRFNDTGFRNKWTGYWAPPYKFLDYYALKLNGVWLDSGTLDATEYGEKFVFHHDTDTLKVDEIVETPDKLPGFRVQVVVENLTDEPKAVQLALEPGVDIREKSEDLGPAEYDSGSGKNRLTLYRDEKKLNISSDTAFDLERQNRVKEHFPGEKQRCYIPGLLKFRSEVPPNGRETIKVEFTTSGGSFGTLRSREQKFNHPTLGRAFNSSVDSLENLVYQRNGTGIIAGHPWFQSYWARDSYWSLLGLIDAGYFELAKKILENFADRDLSSRIMLDDQDESFPRADTAPLFIIAADKLERHHRLSDELEKAQERAMEMLDLDEKVVKHEPKATWMDTLERAPAVDIQSLWLEAADIMDDPRKEELEQGLERFRKDDYMKDHLGEDAPATVNPAVPVMLGHVDEPCCLEKLNAEFSSRHGARTRSMADPGYDSSGYHSGSVWGLTTGWAAAANLKHGKEKQGLNYLENFVKQLDRDQLGALPETVDAETGDSIGAGEQAWSAGLLVHVIDTYLLGIRVREDHVEIDPAEISCERNGKRIGGEELDLRIEDGEAEVLNDPDLDIRL